MACQAPASVCCWCPSTDVSPLQLCGFHVCCKICFEKYYSSSKNLSCIVDGCPTAKSCTASESLPFASGAGRSGAGAVNAKFTSETLASQHTHDLHRNYRSDLVNFSQDSSNTHEALLQLNDPLGASNPLFSQKRQGSYGAESSVLSTALLPGFLPRDIVIGSSDAGYTRTSSGRHTGSFGENSQDLYLNSGLLSEIQKRTSSSTSRIPVSQPPVGGMSDIQSLPVSWSNLVSLAGLSLPSVTEITSLARP